MGLCNCNAARALNAIFERRGIEAQPGQWNISGELCSGSALGASPTIDEQAFNPFIKCDCTFNSSTVCRITALFDNNPSFSSLLQHWSSPPAPADSSSRQSILLPSESDPGDSDSISLP
ncbi:unnamed protein product [Linum tenue]|uniref:Uncharacterized protein n=1 Tax=Linum tenue TaxID=586396 RepID=A0AAV0IYX9_9ROSI|nr:unnamed protein product [Linum tenue]